MHSIATVVSTFLVRQKFVCCLEGHIGWQRRRCGCLSTRNTVEHQHEVLIPPLCYKIVACSALYIGSCPSCHQVHTTKCLPCNVIFSYCHTHYSVQTSQSPVSGMIQAVNALPAMRRLCNWTHLRFAVDVWGFSRETVLRWWWIQYNTCIICVV